MLCESCFNIILRGGKNFKVRFHQKEDNISDVLRSELRVLRHDTRQFFHDKQHFLDKFIRLYDCHKMEKQVIKSGLNSKKGSRSIYPEAWDNFYRC